MWSARSTPMKASDIAWPQIAEHHHDLDASPIDGDSDTLGNSGMRGRQRQV
jgi:hypothetical protein